MLRKGWPNGYPQATFSTVFKHWIARRNLGILALFEISNHLATLDPGSTWPQLARMGVSHLHGFSLEQPTSLLFFTCLAPGSIELLSPSWFALQCCLCCVFRGQPYHQNVNCCSERPCLAVVWCCWEHLAQGYSLNTNEQMFLGIREWHSIDAGSLNNNQMECSVPISSGSPSVVDLLRKPKGILTRCWVLATDTRPLSFCLSVPHHFQNCKLTVPETCFAWSAWCFSKFGIKIQISGFFGRI